MTTVSRDAAGTLLQGIDEERFPEWVGVPGRAMLGTPTTDGEALQRRRARFSLDRCLGVEAPDGRIAAAAAAFGTQLTVPGGEVDAAGVTAVGVLPTHTRRGYMTQMMHAQLSDIADRGEPVAALVAAEYRLYSRFGYGPATEACAVEIDTEALADLPDNGLTAAPSGRAALVDNETFAKALPDLYTAARRRAAGHITWSLAWYEVFAGLVPHPWGEDASQQPKVLWYDDDGDVKGGVVYSTDGKWERNRPKGRLTAHPLLAATDEAQRELVRYLASVDWISHVQIGLRPVDDPTPLWLQEGRASTLVDRSDHVWVRVLDVPTALAARRYQTRGTLVIEVEDPMGHAAGRYRLEVAPDTASTDPGQPAHPAACSPTHDDPDLTLPVDALGAVYLGGFSWSVMAAAGRVQEHTPGAVAHASAMFTTPRAPWCAATF